MTVTGGAFAVEMPQRVFDDRPRLLIPQDARSMTQVEPMLQALGEPFVVLAALRRRIRLRIAL
jgi:hypothetical protein